MLARVEKKVCKHCGKKLSDSNNTGECRSYCETTVPDAPRKRARRTSKADWLMAERIIAAAGYLFKLTKENMWSVGKDKKITRHQQYVLIYLLHEDAQLSFGDMVPLLGRDIGGSRQAYKKIRTDFASYQEDIQRVRSRYRPV